MIFYVWDCFVAGSFMLLSTAAPVVPDGPIIADELKEQISKMTDSTLIMIKSI